MSKRVYVACLLTYSCVVAWVTLRSLPGLDGSADLFPFLDTWRQMRDYGDRSALREVAGNFALFVPFGFFLAASAGRTTRMWRVVAVAGAASLFIEVSQWLFVDGRNPSIDDVIYNTAGAATGAAVFTLVLGAAGYWRGARRTPEGHGSRASE